MNRILALSVIVSFLSVGCKDNEPENPVKETEKITFKGIVERDARGIPYTEDPDDWKFTDKWVEQELSLFGNSLGTNCLLPESYGIIAYPNPCIDKVSIHVNKPDSVRLALRIVDRNFKVLMSKDSLYSKITMFDVGSLGVQDTVRVYYKFMNGSCEFRGHGDVVIKKQL